MTEERQVVVLVNARSGVDEAIIRVLLPKAVPTGAGDDHLQGARIDAEHEHLQEQDAAEVQAELCTKRVDVHLYDPGDQEGPLPLFVPASATVAYLKREIERHSGVMPMYQRVEVRDPDGGRRELEDEDRKTRRSILLSEWFPSQAPTYSVLCSFRPRTPERSGESNAAEVLLGLQGGDAQHPATATAPAAAAQAAARTEARREAAREDSRPSTPPPNPKRKKPAVASPSHQRPAGQKAGRWTAEDVDLLIRLMEQGNDGKWASIKNLGYFPSRSQVDIKDKWRNLVKAADAGPARKMRKPSPEPAQQGLLSD
ncbi:hypothetical protein WJX73_000224 [Symbiochloris irregularis]|uniref:Myb-like domain-containing protein n=1 Tax=Symbiochloris irregularis TaxID=706552 RepID=A0AAW1NY79_9CHLO